MINIYPIGIASSQLMGVPLIPFVYGIPSAEAFGVPNIPAFAGIPSAEAVGSPIIGIWWLHWRTFDERNMFVMQSKVFSSSEDRYLYATHLVGQWTLGEQPFSFGIFDHWGLNMKIRPLFKFSAFVFGRPLLPKANEWDKQSIYLREGLR